MAPEELLKEIIRAKLLSDEEITKIKREIATTERSLEEIIHERRLLGDDAFAEFKSGLLHVPYQKLDIEHFSPALAEVIPEETVRAYKVLPLSVHDDVMVIGMVSPDDTKAQEALKFIARKQHMNLGVYLISYGDWQEALRKYSPYRSDVESAVQSLNLKPGDNTRRLVRIDDGGKSSLEDAPVIRIVARTFEEAVASKASDVHIEPQEGRLRIRFRIDGDLREATSLPVELAQPVVSRVKVISDLKIDESRIPQDGRFRSRVAGREIDFRVSTFPTPAGEKVAIRVLDPSTGLRTLDDLGLYGRNSDVVKEGVKKPFGMIVITGPTGSGKSTTLYALLQTLNEDTVNIVSLEDPVEYYVSGVNQSQVRPEIGYDFASGLRQILRQDPDIVMVGEIRDNETANLAVHAALTGHIVLTTLHTNNAVGAIPRLIDMKVEPFLLPSALNLVIAQRLISLLCEACKSPSDAPEAIAAAIRVGIAKLPDDAKKNVKEPFQIYHAKGCEKCHNKGVVGRIAIFEVLAMTRELETVINDAPTGQKIEAEAVRQHMVTLRADGILKALEGKISMEEVLRETEAA